MKVVVRKAMASDVSLALSPLVLGTKLAVCRKAIPGMRRGTMCTRSSEGGLPHPLVATVVGDHCDAIVLWRLVPGKHALVELRSHGRFRLCRATRFTHVSRAKAKPGAKPHRGNDGRPRARTFAKQPNLLGLATAVYLNEAPLRQVVTRAGKAGMGLTGEGP